jgi:hypothetical protein
VIFAGFSEGYQDLLGDVDDWTNYDIAVDKCS